jgi:hypothetical protein
MELKYIKNFLHFYLEKNIRNLKKTIDILPADCECKF